MTQTQYPPGARGRWRYAALVLSLVVLAGCAGSWASERSPELTPEESRDQVRQSLTDTWEKVKPHGLIAKAASGSYGTCRDNGGWVLYQITGRFEPTPSAPKRPILGKLRESLVGAGWIIDSIKQDGDRRILRAHKGELDLELNEYGRVSFLLWDITGACVKVGKDRDDEYMVAARVDTFTLT
jgi:hypothetical protein